MKFSNFSLLDETGGWQAFYCVFHFFATEENTFFGNVMDVLFIVDQCKN